MQILVAGATGSVGTAFVGKALQLRHINKVIALCRSGVPIQQWKRSLRTPFRGADQEFATVLAEKLCIVSVDWQKLHRESVSDALAGWYYQNVFSNSDVAVSCMGSRSIFSSADVEQVDFDYVTAFAKVVRNVSNTRTFVHLSAHNASDCSRFAYLRTKGRAECVINEYKFPETMHFRPGIIRGTSHHGVQRLSEAFLALVNPKVDVDTVGRAMANLSLNPREGGHIDPSAEPIVRVVTNAEIRAAAQ